MKISVLTVVMTIEIKKTFSTAGFIYGDLGFICFPKASPEPFDQYQCTEKENHLLKCLVCVKSVN